MPEVTINVSDDSPYGVYKRLAEDFVKSLAAQRRRELISCSRLKTRLFYGYRPANRAVYETTKVGLKMKELYCEPHLLLEKRHRSLLHIYIFHALGGTVDGVSYTDDLDTLPVNFFCYTSEETLRDKATGESKTCLLMGFMDTLGFCCFVYEVLSNGTLSPYLAYHNHYPNDSSLSVEGKLVYNHDSLSLKKGQYDSIGLPIYQSFVENAMGYSMELSFLKSMGRNYARLVLDKWEFDRLTRFLFSDEFTHNRFSVFNSVIASTRERSDFNELRDLYSGSAAEDARLSIINGQQHYEVLWNIVKNRDFSINAKNWYTHCLVDYLMSPDAY